MERTRDQGVDYATMVLHLENQLNWLRKQGCTHLNLEEMPQAELHKLLEGVYRIVPEGKATEAPQPPQQPEALQEQIRELSEQLGVEPQPTPPPHDDLPAPPFLSASSSPEPPASSTANATTLQALQQSYHNCQRCALGGTRTNLVFGEGNARARLLFLGEGPGADEDASGRPFVGRAGKLLSKMILSMGIDRPDVYITNVVKCRPPGNRNPEAEEVAKCFPILEQQIALINPALIVTLGNVPTRALIPDIPGITKVRGKTLSYHGRTVLPTFHPAYLLRNRSAFELAWQDFRTAAQLAFSSSSPA